MAKIIVGVGEWAVSGNADDEIKTFALGSCVALILLDPKTRIIGLAHFALPEARIDEKKAQELPTYFVDTGVPFLFEKMAKAGSIVHKGYIVKLIGGANVMASGSLDRFEIGKRNATAIKKILWDMTLPITAEDTGKNFSRTVTVFLSNGKVVVSGADGHEWGV
jgi:chemotaxis protein CheD